MKNRIVPALLLFTLFAVAGCEREGAMERTGENIDEAYQESKETAKDAVDETGDRIDDAQDRARN